MVAIVDSVALAAFAMIGLLSHGKAVDGRGLLRDLVPVLVGWLVVAAIAGTYRHGGARTFLTAWLVGVGGGAVIRGLLLHRHVLGGRYLTFVVVTLVVTLLLLLAGRAALRLATRARRLGAGSF